MCYFRSVRRAPHLIVGSLGCAAVILALWLPSAASAQDRDRNRDRDRVTEIEPGTTIAVRTEQSIDVDRRDNRVYPGVVDRDVRGDNGRVGIPRGSAVELIVRVAPDNDLIIDLKSVMVNGQRYAIKTDPNREESRPDNSLVGSIVGAINGVQPHGRAVRIPHDSVLTFRIDRPLVAGVGDEGYRGRDSDRDRDRVTEIEPGTTIAVRTQQTIDADSRDNRAYPGIVDQDVRGDNGRLGIPRGSAVELIVRVAPDNDLVIDLESVMVNGQRYAIKTDPNREESRRDDSLVGSIVGAINGVQPHGSAVRIPRDSVLTFRIERPLVVGGADHGYNMRNGEHYSGYRDSQ
jgi:hypothetical protein